MTEPPYRIIGAELSPYSVKVRSYFRYKQIPHEWIVRGPANMETFQKYAKLPLVPLVVTPDEQGIQDSTPIIEKLEAEFPEPSIHPPGDALAFLSALLEEFGDEWGNKWMFHLRWAREEDCLAASGRAATMMAPKGDEEARLAWLDSLAARLIAAVAPFCDEPRALLPAQRALLVLAGRRAGPEPELAGLSRALKQIDQQLGRERGGFSRESGLFLYAHGGTAKK